MRKAPKTNAPLMPHHIKDYPQSKEIDTIIAIIDKGPIIHEMVLQKRAFDILMIVL